MFAMVFGFDQEIELHGWGLKCGCPKTALCPLPPQCLHILLLLLDLTPPVPPASTHILPQPQLPAFGPPRKLAWVPLSGPLSG